MSHNGASGQLIGQLLVHACLCTFPSNTVTVVRCVACMVSVKCCSVACWLQVELKQDLVGSCVVGDVVTVLGLVKVLATGDQKPAGKHPYRVTLQSVCCSVCVSVVSGLDFHALPLLYLTVLLSLCNLHLCRVKRHTTASN